MPVRDALRRAENARRVTYCRAYYRASGEYSRVLFTSAPPKSTDQFFGNGTILLDTPAKLAKLPSREIDKLLVTGGQTCEQTKKVPRFRVERPVFFAVFWSIRGIDDLVIACSLPT